MKNIHIQISNLCQDHIYKFFWNLNCWKYDILQVSYFEMSITLWYGKQPWEKSAKTSWYGKQPWEIGAKMKSNVLFMILQHSPNNHFVHGTHQDKKSKNHLRKPHIVVESWLYKCTW